MDVNYNKEYYQKHKDEILAKSNNAYRTKIGRARHLLRMYNKNDETYNRGKGDLTAQWIVDNIFSKSCVHCAENDYTKMGCNRLDNSKPHTMDNVEPCCTKCNNKLAGEEFKNRYGRTVYQYTLSNELVKIWKSVSECKTEGFNAGAVAACCRGIPHYKTYKGYKWSYTPL